MALFSRKRDESTGGVSPGLLRELEAFGRYSYEPIGSALGDSTFEYRMFQQAQASRAGFLAQMAEAARHGGWIAYGVERLVVSVIGGDLPDPEYDEIMGLALGFLRDNKVPNNRLSGYEWNWWLAHEVQSTPWLVGNAAPETSVARALEPGEERHVATMTAEPGSNIILIRAEGDGYAAVIDAAYSDEDPTRSQFVWFQYPELHDLYLRVGEALQTPPYWVDSELRAYIPLSAPGL